MAQVQLEKVSKVYEGADEPAVDALDLDIADGEFVVLVGPSGCGKSTALRMIAGLEQITGGEVRIGEQVVNDIPPKDRDIAMVFQNYALYPHMTVARNLDYPLRIAGLDKKVIAEQVEETARILQLTELLDRKPAQLSGGQRQRVAMGRALIRRPAVFLMDEPLSNLDAKLRVSMRAEIARIQENLGVTTVYVTHDQVEAMTMGDRVVVLNRGLLQQVAPPEQLYNRPANVFVASFIGSPAMNLWNSTFARHADGGGSVSLGEQELPVPAAVVEATGLGAYDGKGLTVGIRPDDLHDDAAEGKPGCVDTTVMLREVLGSEVVCHLDVGVSRLLFDSDLAESGAESLEHDYEFIGRFEPESRAAVGERRSVRFDVNKLHFFDGETGERIDAREPE